MVFVIAYQLPASKTWFFTDSDDWTSNQDNAARWSNWIYVCDMMRYAKATSNTMTSNVIEVRTIDYHGVLDELVAL